MEAREIFIAIKQKIRFQQSNKEKDSHYTILGNTLVRISNHCTWMKVWENYLNEHPECRKMNIMSIVFEDAGDTFCEECLFTVQPRQKPIIVTEYVYKSNTIQKGIVKAITRSLQEMDYTNQYVEPTHSIQPQTRVSKNPPTNESKIHKNMKQNKKTITEAQLRNIVAESVKRVLMEGNEQESVYQTICNLESDLKTVIANTDNSSSQAFGSSEEKLKMIANQLSHIDENMANQGSLTFKKLIEVISELQNLRINLKTYGSEDSYWGHNFKTPNGTVGLSNYR